MIKIKGREISTINKPYIIAELSANHSGSIDIALDTIKSAKECGADAIKLQTYKANSMTLNSEKDDFLIKEGLWEGKRLYDLYEEASTPYEWHEELFRYANQIGITIFNLQDRIMTFCQTVRLEDLHKLMFEFPFVINPQLV